jgi:uncharacterized damage-inducible protein DinB
MRTYFATFAAYNRWANVRLYDAAAKLSDADYRAERGAFFGSLNGTLNHLLVTDRIWLNRFTGSGPQPTRLNDILFDDLAALTEARQAEDERIVAYVDGLSEADLAGTISYRTVTQPKDITQKLTPALAHFFNHQTHHRGQAHTLLTIAGGRDAAPPLDLLYFQRETGIGLT